MISMKDTRFAFAIATLVSIAAVTPPGAWAAATKGETGPTANFSFTTQSLTAKFTDASADSAGTITAHSWSFGDGSTSTAPSPTHTYPTFGVYSVTETVVDQSGESSSKTEAVPITQTGPEPQFLLLNTGFESTASWSTSASVICASGCSGETAHAGTGFAWLDGYGKAHVDTLAQATPVILAGKVTLQFYLHVDTNETSTTKAYDTLTVALYGRSGVLLKTLATYSNLDARTGYTLHSFDVSQFAGQAVTLRFTGREDASLQTSFVLDDVTMVSYAN